VIFCCTPLHTLGKLEVILIFTYKTIRMDFLCRVWTDPFWCPNRFGRKSVVTFCDSCLDGPILVSEQTWQKVLAFLRVQTGWTRVRTRLPVSPNPYACTGRTRLCPEEPYKESQAAHVWTRHLCV
jgi:hypothetical protein